MSKNETELRGTQSAREKVAQKGEREQKGWKGRVEEERGGKEWANEEDEWKRTHPPFGVKQSDCPTL